MAPLYVPPVPNWYTQPEGVQLYETHCRLQSFSSFQSQGPRLPGESTQPLLPHSQVKQVAVHKASVAVPPLPPSPDSPAGAFTYD